MVLPDYEDDRFVVPEVRWCCRTAKLSTNEKLPLSSTRNSLNRSLKMKIPKSWDEIPQAFFRDNRGLFETLLARPIHGQIRILDFYGKTACRTEILLPDAKVKGSELIVLEHAKPSVRFTFWCTDRTELSFLKLSQIADDRIVEAHYLPEDDVYKMVGMARRLFLKSKFGTKFMLALTDASTTNLSSETFKLRV